jgi:succinate dehydrogenase/fumarate reductase flavoprotein subunit
MLKGKAANSQWVSLAMYNSEFNVTEKLAGPIAVKWTTAGEDLHDEIMNVLPTLLQL